MMGEGLKRARATARPSLTVRGESDVARVKDCVNALAGIPDPAAFVRAADALAEAVREYRDPGCSYRVVSDALAAYREARVAATTERES